MQGSLACSIKVTLYAALIVLVSCKSKEQEWMEWRTWIPMEFGCSNGSLKWKQIESATFTHPSVHEKSPAYTDAKLLVTLTLPDGEVITEDTIGEKRGNSSFIKGKKIYALQGTSSMHFALNGKTLCMADKFKGLPDGWYTK